MNATVQNPLVSIVVATYNGERFLAEQIDSLIGQTYQNLEIIIVDDGSTDGTLGILDRYADQYPYVTVVKNERNLGYQKNFEKGFLLAKGDYIAPCDQDDIWLPNKIEVLVNNRGDYAIVYCDSAFIDANGALLGQKMSEAKVLTDFDHPMMFAVGGSVPGHAMLIMKQLVLDTLPFPDDVMPHDYWLAFVATFHSSLKFINEPLVLYRRHDTNLFGSIKSKNKRRETPRQRVEKARLRVNLLYEKCPDDLTEVKQAYRCLVKSYESYSLANNFARMRLFFKYRREILAYKRRNALMRCLYCIKVFFRII